MSDTHSSSGANSSCGSGFGISGRTRCASFSERKLACARLPRRWPQRAVAFTRDPGMRCSSGGRSGAHLFDQLHLLHAAQQVVLRQMFEGLAAVAIVLQRALPGLQPRGHLAECQTREAIKPGNRAGGWRAAAGVRAPAPRAPGCPSHRRSTVAQQARCSAPDHRRGIKRPVARLARLAVWRWGRGRPRHARTLPRRRHMAAHSSAAPSSSISAAATDSSSSSPSVSRAASQASHSTWHLAARYLAGVSARPHALGTTRRRRARAPLGVGCAHLNFLCRSRRSSCESTCTARR